MTDFGDVLSLLGATPAEIEEARRTGTLLALAADRFLIPGERIYDVRQAAEAAGVDSDEVARLWIALGFPRVAAGERRLTETDAQALALLLHGGQSISDYFVHEARLVSGALSRVAEVLVDEMWDQHLPQDRPVEEVMGEMAAEGIDMERLERLLLFTLRRQIVAAMYRRSTLRDTGTGPTLAVGFADLVGFTALSQQLDPMELARVIVGFEEVGFDLVHQAGGRVVKTIGDELMFTAPEPLAAARVGLDLACSLPAELPRARVALAWGPVLLREGDCFGSTVNLASRMVGVAPPGGVLVSDELRVALGDDPPMHVLATDDRQLRDFGLVKLWELRP